MHADGQDGIHEAQAASPTGDLERAEAAFAEHYRSLVEDSSDFTIRLNAERVVEWISPSVRNVIGFTAEEIIGRSGFDFIRPDTHEEVRSIIARRDAGERLPARLQVLCKDGTYIWMYQFATILYDSDGNVTGAVGAFRSIDEQVRLEAELAEAEARFRQLADRAEEVEERAATLGGPTHCSIIIAKGVPGETSDTLVSRLAAGRYRALDEGLGIVEMG